jgi:hypothetical protein
MYNVKWGGGGETRRKEGNKEQNGASDVGLRTILGGLSKYDSDYDSVWTKNPRIGRTTAPCGVRTV